MNNARVLECTFHVLWLENYMCVCLCARTRFLAIELVHNCFGSSKYLRVEMSSQNHPNTIRVFQQHNSINLLIKWAHRSHIEVMLHKKNVLAYIELTHTFSCVKIHLWSLCHSFHWPACSKYTKVEESDAIKKIIEFNQGEKSETFQSVNEKRTTG